VARSVVIIGQRGRLPQVLWYCENARRAGVRPGMTLAEALAVVPGLSVHAEDPESDLRRLTQLAKWCDRFSPLAGLEETAEPSSLLLDMTGCTGNFGGEEQMIEQVRNDFAAEGWQTRVALAETVGAAWALAHTGESASILVRPGEIEPALLPLPVAVLRLPVETLHHLAQLGLERVGQLLALPRSGLSERFGPGLLRRIDQALGCLAEPIARYRPVPAVLAGRSFEYPIERRDALQQALNDLLRQIETRLQERCRGARRLECWLYVEAGSPLCIELELHRPSRCAQRLGKLLETKLEQVQLTGPLSGLCVRVPLEEPLTQRQLELFAGHGCLRDGEFSDLIDGLSSRLGRDSVTVARLIPDPQPELACRFEPAILDRKADARTAFDERTLRHRPLQIWPAPVPIQVLAVVPGGLPKLIRSPRGEYTVTLSWGPERIETGWWRGRDIHRDYFIVETHLGTRLWIFRRHDDDRWFWHGCFG
jgi:protein ImuB